MLHIGPNNPRAEYFLAGNQIQAVPELKDIGYWLTEDLSPKTHILKARGRALGEISKIKRNFSYIDKKAFCILYNQRVRPHVDHGMLANPPANSEHIKMLEQVQGKATSKVWGLRHLNAEERRRSLGLMTLKQRQG